MPAHRGFGILAALWFFTGLPEMLRSVALTLAALSLRNELPFMLFVLRWPFPRSYITVSGLGWLPNVLVAEWMVRRRNHLAQTPQAHRVS